METPAGDTQEYWLLAVAKCMLNFFFQERCLTVSP
ncbi:hypothetical protein ACHAXR_003960 [Thalassiosira sp. AJA248-18]